MKIGLDYIASFKFKNDYFNFLKVGVCTPYISAESDIHDFFAEEQKSYQISANTSIGLALSTHHWSFHFLVLGFGIRITRQWSY